MAQIETVQSMERREKAEFVLEQVFSPCCDSAVGPNHCLTDASSAGQFRFRTHKHCLQEAFKEGAKSWSCVQELNGFKHSGPAR